MPNLPGLETVRAPLVRYLLSALFGLAMIFAFASPAQTQDVPRAYAGIAVDAKTGQVLYQEHANDLRYPASLTKVMTLYIVFQELEAGRLTLDTKLRVSQYASQAVPMKLWVQPGSTIRLEDAIKSLVTISANDVARVIAENISGTEAQFAERMTQTARALGMSRTTYKNANGLPNSGQVTTAADQAILARAVFLHFPHHYDYFQVRSFQYRGKTYNGHNGLLGQNGVDGIKTGYINASGYNLMTAARSNNRHIVVIGLGFDTGAARNVRVAELVRTYLPKARQGDYWREAMIPRPTLLGNGVAVASAGIAVPLAGLPPRRPNSLLPIITDAEAAMHVAAADPVASAQATSIQPDDIPFEIVSANDIPSRPEGSALDQANYVATGAMPANAPIYPADDPIGAWISETLKLAEPDVGNLQPGQILTPPAPIARPVDLMSTNSAETIPGGGWIVQVGTANSETEAVEMLTDAAETHANLANLRGYIQRFDRYGITYYRARFAGFADRHQARIACDALIQSSVACLSVQS